MGPPKKKKNGVTGLAAGTSTYGPFDDVTYWVRSIQIGGLLLRLGLFKLGLAKKMGPTKKWGHGSSSGDKHVAPLMTSLGLGPFT